MYFVLINLVTPRARTKHEPFVQQTGLRMIFEKQKTSLDLINRDPQTFLSEPSSKKQVP